MQALIDNVVVGLIAAAICGGVTLMIRVLRDLALRRRFPVAGTYGSEYVDREDGATLSVKATAVLEQRGRHVWGVTTNLSDGRRWRLDGRVDDGGRIFGTYGADNPHDVGLGGFFLELRGDGTLEGMWTGYDSVNKSVEAGQYRFWPLHKTIVSPMKEGDIDEALVVLGEALGQRYITRSTLETYKAADTVAGRTGFVCRASGGVLLGAVTAQLLGSSEALIASLPADSGNAVANLVPELVYHRIGMVKSVATTPGSRSRGVGTALVREATNWLWRQGATCVVMIGWTDTGGCHIAGLAEGLGFQQEAVIAGFWTQESEQLGYACPSCGNPCRCEARVFVANRNERSEDAPTITTVGM